MEVAWRGRWFRGALWVLVLGLVVVLRPQAAAAQGEPITANDFRIDAIPTPVLGGSRIVGLGGAFTALAEGIDSVPYNPAGYAARFAYEHEWYEWELSAGVQFAGAFTDVDYFLNGKDTGLGPVSGFYGANAAGRLQFAQLGLGGSFQLEVFDVRADDPVDVNFITYRFGGGYNLLDGQLAIGGGAQIVGMTIDEGNIPLVDFTGIGFEAGAVLRMTNRRWRVGLMARTGVDARVLDANGNPTGPPEMQSGFILPISVNVPWEIRGGFAWQFLERPFNPRFSPPKNVKNAIYRRLERNWCERERAQALRELGAVVSEPAGEGAPTMEAEAAVGRCPELRRRPRDHAWWREERARRAEERAQALVELERGRRAIADFWDELEASRARRYVLISADLRLLGPVPDAIGVDAFIAQDRFPRGERVSVGWHVGAESEPWPTRLKVRAGIYYEPARYRGVTGRLGAHGRFHGTVGFDFRVIEILGADLRAGFYVDGARDWVNWGISIGGWH